MNEQVKTGKHPKALYVLFLTEMWERFGYYLMVGILFLYLTTIFQATKYLNVKKNKLPISD